RMVKPFVTAEAGKNFRVFAHGGSDIGDASVIALGDDEAANHEALQKEYLSLRSSSRGGGQVVLGLDVGLSQKESAEAAKIWSAKLVDLCRTVRNNGDLLVMVNRTGLDTIPLCKTVSDIHMQITNKSGVHFTRVQKPAIEGPTILFSLSAGEKKYPSYVLKKVV
ncbi:MAG TPA: hypothetical protein VJL54_08950, partial [Nitrososphaera sp.]|nr:hypothetical protein [Nitrososphaera sp.]